MHTSISSTKELFERGNAVTLDLSTVPAQYKNILQGEQGIKKKKKLEIEASLYSVRLLKCRDLLILKEFLQRLLWRIC